MTDTDVRRIDPMAGIDDDAFDDTPKVPLRSNTSPLDALRETISAEVVREPIVLSVLARPGLAVRFNTNIDFDTIQMWHRRSRDKSMPNELNLLKFSSLVVANTAEAFLVNGEQPNGEDGQPFSFRTKEVLDWTRTKRALDAVRALYGRDGHVIATAQDVLEAAGFGDVMMEEDESPTRGS